MEIENEDGRNIGNVLYLGGNSSDPRIFSIVPGSSGQGPVPIGGFQDRKGLGIYAISLSSEQRFLAAASRPSLNRQGKVVSPSIIRAYSNPGKIPDSSVKPTFEIYHSSGVWDLAVTDNGLIAAACGDGAVRVYSITESVQSGRPVSEISSGHEGHACAISWADTNRIVSLGKDGFLKIWDYPSCRCLYSSVQQDMPKHYTMMSLAVDRTRKLVYHGTGNGMIHVVSFDGKEDKQIQAHGGDVIAVCYHPVADRLITGGLKDRMIRVWVPGEFRKESESNTGDNIYGLVSLRDASFACTDEKGLISLWEFGSSLHLQSQLARVEARSWAGPDLDSLANDRKTSASKAFEQSRDRAREMINAQSFEDALKEIRSLAGQGFSDDALLLQGMVFRKQGLLLKEYEIWQDLMKHHGGKLPGDACTYLYADLCELLLEPKLAVSEFVKITDYRDARNRADINRQHPFYGPDADEIIRGDFQKSEQVLDEIGKYSLLGKPFTSTVVITTTVPQDISANINIQAVSEECQKKIQEKFKELKCDTVDISVFVNGRLSKKKWIRVGLTERRVPESMVQFSLEISQSHARSKYVAYALFSPGRPPAHQDALSWNRDVAQWWSDIFHDKDKLNRDWIDGLYESFKNVLKKADNIGVAENYETGF
jgi:hypothetical protein